MPNAAFWKASKTVKPAHTARVFAAAMYSQKRYLRNQKKHSNKKQIPFPKPSSICLCSGFSLIPRGIAQGLPVHQKLPILVQL